MKPQSSRLLELDALRGIAALAVVFDHITLNRPQGKDFWVYGLTGVDLFFMISGFVIFMSLEHIKNAKEFIIRRVTRLYPAYWVCLSITTLLLIAFNVEDLGRISLIRYLGNVTMFQMYLGQPHIDPAYWTLTVELCFYLIMLAIYKLGKTEKIENLGFFGLIILFAYSSYLKWHAPSELHLTALHSGLSIIYCFPLFFSGVIYYRMLMRKPTLKHYFLLIFCLITKWNFGIIDYRLYLINPHIYYFILIFFNLVFLLFINGKLKFLVNPASLFFGRISYPLYLINSVVSILILMPWLTKYMNFWLSAFITLAILVSFAYIITAFVEKPMQQSVRKRLIKVD
jgi:peptidoglycan/LPS O-acetylase OafA/YrhL